MNVFDFRPGRSIKNVNPQLAGAELEKIRNATGGAIKPADVVEAARAEESPLHAAFEWDDTEAAHQHRLAQARQLITSIRVLNSPAAKPIVAYVSVKTPGQGRGYVPMVEAMSDEELRARVMTEVHEALEAIRRKYTHFEEVASLISRIKTAVA